MSNIIKREFDSNNNCIYNEYSAGYWWKQEFDVNGNQIYYEDSYGEQIYFII